MDDNRLHYLHQKYISNQMSSKELDEWKTALNASEISLTILQLMNDHWLAIDVEERFDFKPARFDEIYKKVIDHKQHKSSSLGLWLRIGMAAAIAIVIFGAGLLLLKNHAKNENLNRVASQNDIAPGKFRATLTLASGEKIKLTESIKGELATEAGVLISKAANGALVYEIVEQSGQSNKTNTLSTANGETYTLRLPDGSMVWLNAASSLTYYTSFKNHAERSVKLIGEAYFEVAKDNMHPFIVESSEQRVKVLGTHFNINAYANEPVIRTTLMEGKVVVSSLVNPQAEKILQPGQQSVMADEHLVINPVEVIDVIGWKNGEFIFDNESLESIMRKIARWYDVEIVYQDVIAQDKLWGSISRYNDISKVLEKLTFTSGLRFELKGRKLYVSNT